jgi:hypothetical protein
MNGVRQSEWIAITSGDSNTPSAGREVCAFDDIKKYLSSPPVIKAPTTRIPFWLYIATEDGIIGVVLTQVMDNKEHIITYLSRHLIDAETRYSFIEKLCLCMFYACSKLQHYLLSSTC